MKQDTRGPADLEYQIEYLTNQNDFLKRSNKKLVEKISYLKKSLIDC